MANSDPIPGIPAHVLPYLDEHKHRLILTDEVRDYHGILCCSCKTPVRSGWSYACLPCAYAVHKQCPETNFPRPSIWLPKSKIFDEIEVKMLGLVSQEVIAKGSYKQCLRCGEDCRGTIKCVCSNGFDCHESCSLLPAEIQHPFHDHKLTLGFPSVPIRNPAFNPSEICYFCRSKLRQSSTSRLYQVYLCNLCNDFYVHIECAQQMPMLKHSVHEHPLSLLRIKQGVSYRYNDVNCDWCGRGCSEATVDFGVYRCVACDFSIHESCLKYRKVIVNEDEHQHPMRYIPPFGHDRRMDEYEWGVGDYCEACAKDIAQDEPIYKCLKCPNEFLFHRHCALSSSEEFVEPDISQQQVEELCERNAPFQANMLPVERMSELMAKIECLTLDLEGYIRLLTTLKLIRKDLG